MGSRTLRQALNQLGWGGKYSPHATLAAVRQRCNVTNFRWRRVSTSM